MKYSVSSALRDPIAIIGIGCRFPGNVSTPQTFWDLLTAGTDALGDIPADRWNIERYYHPDPSQSGKMYTRRGGFIDAFDRFDASFFGISPVEAMQMDPQQRLLLEVSWEALEDGGLVPQSLAGTQTGVFIGISSLDARVQPCKDATDINVYSNLGLTSSIAANRLSYTFDFHGPSLSVDTACSSSLVGMHLACESIWKGECQLALAGGANIILDPKQTIGFCKAQMLSHRGQCRAFDAEADGYVRSEGAGIVVLKPLSAALQDGDPIYALLLATGINQDGKTSGITQPSGTAQEALLRQVYNQAGIEPHQVQYVEAHGTGTFVGDPIEACALGNILGRDRAAGQWLHIGSVKTNIGHLESASGIAGLIKTALILKHRQIPANLHFETPNPKIPFEELHLKVPKIHEVLPVDASPLIAGVNSFGFGGTNAHITLQAFQPSASQTVQDPDVLPYLLPLSTRSREALHALARSYQEITRRDSVPTLRDLCYTASMRREHHPHRLALTIQSYEDLIEKLEAFLAGEARPGITSSHHQFTTTPRIAFVFSGNGPQWWAMGRQLLEQEPLFREIVERCDRSLQSYTDWSLLEELQANENHSRIHQTEIGQPALFALQIALTALWQSWGIDPQAVIGHSVGEIAAAYIAGVLSFEDAIQVVFHRSRLQGLTVGQGTMVAVSIPVHEAWELIAPFEDRLSLASINAPNAVTLSGEEAALEQITIALDQKDIFYRYLPLNYAFHSHFMDPTQEELLHSLAKLCPQASRLPFLSTVTGQYLTGPECNAQYWWENIRWPVQFAAGIQRLIADGITVFLEIGPHPVLSMYMTECLAEAGKEGIVIPSLRRQEDERTILLNSLGTLYTQGYPVVWRSIVASGMHVDLPHYPWQHDRSYWKEPQDEYSWKAPQGKRQGIFHPLLGSQLATASPIWQQTLELYRLPYLREHEVHHTALFPIVGYIEMALAAATTFFEEETCTIEQLEIHKPLPLSDNQAVLLQTTISKEDSSLHIYSQQQAEAAAWTLQISGHLHHLPAALAPIPIDLESIRARCTQYIRSSELYQELAKRGLHYGPHFQNLESLYSGAGEALGIVRWTQINQPMSEGYHIHPALLESCLHVMLAIIVQGQPLTYLPISIARVCFYYSAHSDTQFYSYARLIKQGPNYYKADCVILNAQGMTLMELRGIRLQVAQLTNYSQPKPLDSYLYESRWFLQPRSNQVRMADYLPSPTALASRLRPVIEQVNREVSASQWVHQRQPMLDRLSSAYILAALRHLGWNFEPGECFDIATVQKRLRVDTDYSHLLSLWSLLLKEEGILKQDDNAWIVTQVPEAIDPEVLVRKIQRECPDCHAELMMLTRCGRELPGILTGEIDPFPLIFSEQTDATMEQLYESTPISRRSNRLIQEAVKEIIDNLPENRTLRILEIGAGAGGTTSYLLPLLPSERVTYVFTDISETLIRKAQQKFRDYPFVRYQVLDIEQDSQGQGLMEDPFDLIIASHVFHATRDIHETLNHVYQLLASEGMLCLIEITNPLFHVMVLVFGLLKSYWCFQDKDLRPMQPLLHAPQWIRVLDEAGFSETAIIGELQEAQEQSSAIFLARKPGIEQSSGNSSGYLFSTDSINQDVTPFLVQSRKRREPVLSSFIDSWLVFADTTGAAKQMQEYLGDTEQLISVSKGESYQRLAPRQFVLRPHHFDDMQQLFNTLHKEQLPYERVIYLWGLDQVLRGATNRISTDLSLKQAGEYRHSEGLTEEAITTADLNEALEDSCISIVFLIQELTKAENNPVPHLCIVTSGVQVLGEGAQPISIQQAPLSGLGRVIANEHPELHCSVIDISVPYEVHGSLTYNPAEIESLCTELSQMQETESEVVLRHNDRFVNRIVHAPLTDLAHSDAGTTGNKTTYRLEIPVPGALDTLTWSTVSRRKPGPQEIEIAVVATGLNFKDVMLTMGMLTGEVLETGYSNGLSLGFEYAGKIVARGEGVTNFQVGDEVMGFSQHGFSPFVTIKAHYAMRKPAHISFEEAATLPMTFLTAHYALHYQGRLSKGERVLIHGAAGGVGLAAIQIVQQAGGEVFATAGSEEKRAYLHTLSVDHVLDSRSLAFAEEIMRITEGQGVDIVLNSLAGEAMVKSLDVLRHGGRFIEMGKRDVLEDGTIRLRPFLSSLSYSAIDVNIILGENLPLTQQLLGEMQKLFEQDVYRPLPYRLFLPAQIIDAFRYMQQSQHIGKIVVGMQYPLAAFSQQREKPPYAFRPNASYLITGGLSGFGLATARWMVQQGARYLILINRSGKVSQEAASILEEMKAAGVQLLITGTDVTRDHEVTYLFEQIYATMPPLHGVIHSAMVLDDRSLLQLDEESIKRVVEPKMLGAWYLHLQTQKMPLDFFVLFSSVSSLVGIVGQGNYVAANAFMEALSFYRRKRGLPALAIEWGALAQVGYVARHRETQDSLAQRGIRTLAPEQALHILGQLLQDHRSLVGAFDLDWKKLSATLSPLAQARLEQILGQQEEMAEQEQEMQKDFSTTLLEATDNERQELVQARLMPNLIPLLGPSIADRDPRAEGDLGLDSLIALELHNSIQQSFDIDIPTLKLLRLRSIVALSISITELLIEKISGEH